MRLPQTHLRLLQPHKHNPRAQYPLIAQEDICRWCSIQYENMDEFTRKRRDPARGYENAISLSQGVEVHHGSPTLELYHGIPLRNAKTHYIANNRHFGIFLKLFVSALCIRDITATR
jgi:hypothetical protein